MSPLADLRVEEWTKEYDGLLRAQQDIEVRLNNRNLSAQERADLLGQLEAVMNSVNNHRKKHPYSS